MKVIDHDFSILNLKLLELKSLTLCGMRKQAKQKQLENPRKGSVTMIVHGGGLQTII